MALSKEVFIYGLTLIGSGISQLVAFPTIYWPLSLYVEYFAAVLIVMGMIMAVVGLRWKWGPWMRPMGITLIAISFLLVGLVSIVLGGWLYTPLFLLAIASFTITWLLWTGRSFGILAVALLTFIGLMVSVIGVTNDGVVFVPGVLGAFFTFWYIDRPQVTEHFKLAPFMIKVTLKRLALILVFAILLPLPLAYLYANPPSRTISSTMGGNGGGRSGSEYYFWNGDTLTYMFEVNASSPSIEFSIKQDLPPTITLVQGTGRSGSGTASVPFSAQYTVWFEPQDSWADLSFEIVVLSTSWRRSVVQWGLLDIYFTTLLLAMIWLERKKAARAYPTQRIPSERFQNGVRD